ncbi:hypothetical protein [Dactylosporangium sp. NPDC000521]|uniref:hypothetical protein n=1 Tax=Dactylosporangium sp. NPDC000521 TaxID=3363975 RepID=UPI0036BD1873
MSEQFVEPPALPGFVVVDFGTSSSSVTLFDSRLPGDADEEQSAALRAGLAALLGQTPPDTLREEWAAALAALAAEVGAAVPAAGVTDAETLAAWLPVAGASDRSLLDAAGLAFEHLLAAAGPALQRWFAPHLLACYDEVFRVPALSSYQLRPVEVAPSDPRGLPRRRLLTTAKADELIGQVYRQLVEQAETFATSGTEPVSIEEVVVTLPGVTAPAARRRIADVIRESLGGPHVVTSFDEAVAAGLFFLMRDLGPDPERGVESLLARSRRIGDDPPTWEHNMLVMDIGAGGTDVALLRLTMVDASRQTTDRTPSGRWYRIQPQVIASAGDGQLGGDYLTLRTFHWLKARILDALLTGPGHVQARARLRERVRALIPGATGEESLAARVARSAVDVPVPAELLEALRDVLPTHFRNDAGPGSDRRLAFQRLWKLAEDVKIQLGAAGRIHLSRELLDTILDPMDRAGRHHLRPLVPPVGIDVSSGEFESLARPVLEMMARLAGQPVTTLSRRDEVQHLDRVALSGRTSTMPLAQRVIAEHLPLVMPEQIRWNPASLTVAAGYAKQAVSIGAGWGRSLMSRSHINATEELAAGRTVVSVELTTEPYPMLPFDLVLLRPASAMHTLVPAGTRMSEFEDGELIAARSDWSALPPLVDVHRALGSGQFMQWASFRYETYAHDVEMVSLDRSVWLSDQSARPQMQIEVDRELDARINICWGEPHYVVNSNDALDIRDGLAEHCSLIVDQQVVVPSWDPAAPLTERFPLFVHETGDVQSPAIPALVAVLPPASHGGYTFQLRRPDGSLSPAGVLRCDPVAGQYVITLDVRGRLALHRGWPPYWRAANLRSVEQTPGAVFSTRMLAGADWLRVGWDPFSGTH